LAAAQKQGATPRNLGADKNRAHERVLEKINKRLIQFGLPPLSHLGDHTQGEFEINRILSVNMFGEFYAVVTYAGTKPDGKEGTYYVLVNAEHVEVESDGGPLYVTGALCIVTINDAWVGLVKQHRPTLGEWKTEFPRSFITRASLPFGRIPRTQAMFSRIDVDMRNVQIRDIPFGLTGRELGPLVASKQLELEHVALLELVSENSGISRNRTAAFWISLRTNDEGLVGELNARVTSPQVLFVPLRELRGKGRRKYGLDGSHDLAALRLLFEEIDG
jgi:hypothetical protein